MTDTSGSTTNPFADLAASMGASGGAVDPRLADPEFFMRYSEVGKFANRVASHGQALSETSRAIKSIDLPMGTFGVIGGGLNGVHDRLRDQAAEAIAKGKAVLDSWKLALDKAVENAKEGEKQSSGKTGKGGLDGLGGGAKGAGLPKGLGLGGGLPKGGPGSGLPADWKLPKGNPGTGLDGLEQPDLPGSNGLPGSGGGGYDLPDPGDLPGTGLDPNGPYGPNGPGPGDGLGGGLDPNGLNVNGPGRTGLDQNALNPQAPNIPGGTALSSHTPTSPAMPKLPDLGVSGYGPTDYPPVTRTGTGSGGYVPGGYGSGAYGAGVSPGYGGAGRTGIGAGGIPAVPYAPMAGPGNGGDGKERDRGPALPEDESTWFGDEDVAPAVLGMQEED
ncbi:hypothetical protein GCM10010116_36350 [Microbispora rosea subsp. aerata]|nr:hypothetical protein [Microbispora rosea]GGO18028.1 hypothetical protein GCM10010116_36350 [Microbispora rosea subsp. aerata]GIH56729.1 hypothetical protein Mro02_36430 [Microbispora rosea subsp. aerata]GLJ82102.1 hypothetical protein GCM10017588_08270 [Microbispora rosea subsp. aerata]